MAATIVIATSDQRKMVMVFEMKVLTLVAVACCSALIAQKRLSSSVTAASFMMSLMSSGGVTTADLACSVSEVESDDACDSMNFLAAAAMAAICWLESADEEGATGAMDESSGNVQSANSYFILRTCKAALRQFSGAMERYMRGFDSAQKSRCPATIHRQQ